jgi:hypothetical protein
MMVLPVPGCTSHIEDVFDISGVFPNCITGNNFDHHNCVKDLVTNSMVHYASSEWCKQRWNIEANTGHREIDPQTVRLGTNTIVLQQSQYVWSGDGQFATRVKGRGHWQDQIYTGVAAERSGRKPAILRGRGGVEGGGGV